MGTQFSGSTGTAEPENHGVFPGSTGNFPGDSGSNRKYAAVTPVFPVAVEPENRGFLDFYRTLISDKLRKYTVYNKIL